jgi:hypothetical protein
MGVTDCRAGLDVVSKHVISSNAGAGSISHLQPDYVITDDDRELIRSATEAMRNDAELVWNRQQRENSPVMSHLLMSHLLYH